jgi:hypothetical protein
MKRSLLRRIVGERDLVAELSMVRAVGRSLVGPDPTAVVAAMPAEWVVAYGAEVLERWQQLTDDAEHAALMVLTACRIWRFAVERVHCSKTEAAHWALLQEPALPAVEVRAPAAHWRHRTCRSCRPTSPRCSPASAASSPGAYPAM